MFLGSTLGSFVPMTFGDNGISLWSILGSTVGGVLGLWGGYKFNEWMGG